MKTTELRQSGAHAQRWLSVPLSRLVLNPYNFDAGEATHAAYSDRTSLPLNLGYLNPFTRSGSGEWLEDVLTFHEASRTSGSVQSQFAPTLCADEPWRSSAPDSTTMALGNGRLSLTVHRTSDVPWQCAIHPVSLDLDSHPKLILTVEPSEKPARWAVKLCPVGESDVTLIGDNMSAGTMLCDVATVLGRTGRLEGELKIFSIGYEQTLCVSHVEIIAVRPTHRDAHTFCTAWSPEALEMSAQYPSGLSLEGFDTFRDESTVLRRITARGGNLRVCGRIKGQASWQDNTLTVRCPDFTYAITADRPLTLSYFRTLSALLTDTDPQDSPDGALFFSCELPAADGALSVTFAVTVLSDATEPARVGEICRASLDTSAEAARETWRTYWDDYLGRVPHPSPAHLQNIDPMGVTDEQLRQMYYIGWIFVAQSLLPENPELDYPYVQVACGKPSMWAYGDEKSAYSASWESFFGMQMLAMVMPDAAWSALEGLLSLVGKDGMLGGESLPSEKAHTAWVLYRHTGDKERLSAVYDAIDRYLRWRIQNPRWIYLEHNDPDAADADFIVSALIDIEYMQKIALALGKHDDAQRWHERYRALLQNYYRWSFDEHGNACQMCNKKTMERGLGHPVWTTKGLLIAELDSAHEQMLMDRLMAEYREHHAFGGLDSIVKYPVYSQTVLGLIRTGRKDLARKLVEMSLRDIVRVGMFSENYSGDPTPVPTGVRPSMFGCAMMLDSTLLLDGFSSQKVDRIVW